MSKPARPICSLQRRKKGENRKNQTRLRSRYAPRPPTKKKLRFFFSIFLFLRRFRSLIVEIDRTSCHLCDLISIFAPISGVAGHRTSAIGKMLRQAHRVLSRAAWGATRRAFSADALAPATADAAFVEAWKKVAPNIEPPKTPLSFMQPRPPTPASIPSKLTVNFVLPYQSELSAKEVMFTDGLL